MSKIKSKIKIGILLSVIIFAVGCSNDESWQSPVSSAPTESASVQSPIEYNGMVIQLPDGWEPVQVPQPGDRLDAPRDRSGQREGANTWTCVSRRAERDIFLNQITYNWTGCWIWGTSLPRNRMDIEVCVDSINAICEFGPHGTLFNSDIWIRIDFQYLGLDPAHIDLQRDVAIFYVQDNGELLEMPHWVDMTGHALVGTTNHFSRYIVTQRISG